MKRRIVFILCALTVAAASPARAQTIDLTLNLRYNDPFDPSEGGAWYLLAETTGGSPNAGIASLTAYINNISTAVYHGSGVPLGPGQNPAHGAYPTVGQADINNIANSGVPYGGTVSGAVKVVYGQDVASNPPTILGGIGQGSGPHNVAVDILKNPNFNNYSVLLSGIFETAARPSFAPLTGDTITSGSVLDSAASGAAALPATIAAANLHVRGDSMSFLQLNTPQNAGLRSYDPTRDGTVGPADTAAVFNNWGPTATDRTWDRGDVNDDGTTGPADITLLFGAWSPNDNRYIPPAASPIPEPTSLTQYLPTIFALAALHRRRSAFAWPVRRSSNLET